MKDKLRAMLEKIKSNRHLQIAIVVVIVMLVILGYFIFTSVGKSNDESANSNATYSSEAEEYARSLENKLEQILSSVKGAGKVKVLVTLESGFEYVYATEESTKETSSGKVTTSEVVLVGGQPVITQTIYPKISGVLVSASGASDTSVKMSLITALKTVIDVANDEITILTGV